MGQLGNHSNLHGGHDHSSEKFKLEAEDSVAAGPVGRNAVAATALKLSAEILSYSCANGMFAGVTLDGAEVQADKSGDKAIYGEHSAAPMLGKYKIMELPNN